MDGAVYAGRAFRFAAVLIQDELSVNFNFVLIRKSVSASGTVNVRIQSCSPPPPRLFPHLQVQRTTLNPPVSSMAQSQAPAALLVSFSSLI